MHGGVRGNLSDSELFGNRQKRYMEEEDGGELDVLARCKTSSTNPVAVEEEGNGNGGWSEGCVCVCIKQGDNAHMEPVFRSITRTKIQRTTSLERLVG